MTANVWVFYCRDSHCSHHGNLFTVLCRPRVSSNSIWLPACNRGGVDFFICVNDGIRKRRNPHDDLRTLLTLCVHMYIRSFGKKSKRAYWVGDISDGGMEERVVSVAMRSCQSLPSDASMLMQYVPRGTFCTAPIPAALRKERFTHDTSGQAFSSRQTRLMISQKPWRRPQLFLP